MKHLVEIGCSGMSSLENFVNENSFLEIFEPNPFHVEEIRQRYPQPNVIVHPYALSNQKGTAKLYCCGVLSYLEGVHSPAVANYGYVPDNENAVEVETRTFDEFDDGTIDFLDLDAEGLRTVPSKSIEIYGNLQENLSQNPNFVVRIEGHTLI